MVSNNGGKSQGRCLDDRPDAGFAAPDLGNDPQSGHFKRHPQDVSDRELRLPRRRLHELDSFGFHGEDLSQERHYPPGVGRFTTSFSGCVFSYN